MVVRLLSVTNFVDIELNLTASDREELKVESNTFGSLIFRVVLKIHPAR